MSNQWGRPPGIGKHQSITKGIFIILLIGILAYLFFPKLKNKIDPLLKPTYTETNSSNYNLPNTNNSLAQNSSKDSVPTTQDSPSMYNLSSDTKNKELTTGYWLLLTNGQLSQLSGDVQTNAFIQQLIDMDRNSIGKNTLVHVENGLFRQYMISDEINSVLANLLVINTRVSKGSVNTSPNSSAYNSSNSSAN